MFYDSTGLNLATTAALVNGRRILSYTVPGTDANAPKFGELLNPSSSNLRATAPDINAFPSDFQVMYAHNATLQVEREVVKDFAVNLQYSFWGYRFSPYARDINAVAGTDLNSRLGSEQLAQQRQPDQSGESAVQSQDWVCAGRKITLFG